MAGCLYIKVTNPHIGQTLTCTTNSVDRTWLSTQKTRSLHRLTLAGGIQFLLLSGNTASGCFPSLSVTGWKEAVSFTF